MDEANARAGKIVTRQRWFCSVCGALTQRLPDDGRYARCTAHSALPRERDLIPLDPFETIPTMRDDLAALTIEELVSRAALNPWGDAEGQELRRRREAAQATEGMEA